MKSIVTKLEQVFRDEAQERPESFVAYDKTQYVWYIEFADGTKGKTSTPKDHPRFQEGEEASFTIERTVHGNKIKYVDEEKPSYNAPNKGNWQPKTEDQLKLEQKVMYPAFTLSYSKDFVIANMAGRSEANFSRADAEKYLFELADKMLEWLNKNS